MALRADGRFILLFWLWTLLLACTDFGYYMQASQGQLELIRNRTSIDELVLSEEIESKRKYKLLLIKQITSFAQQDLGLPVGGAYSDFVEIDRPHVVWNVFASQPYSFESKQWCYPMVGCVSYRGYFNLASAERYGDELEKQGLDVYIGGVSAYSTLGWFDDPVLSTFLMRRDFELAALIFHELSHRVLYIKGDTTFNESFATAVEQIALDKWVKAQNRPELLSQYKKANAKNAKFVDFILAWKETLQKGYQISDIDSEKQKSQLYEQLLADYQLFRFRTDYHGYDHWIENNLNNAKINTIATYEARVPEFNKVYLAAGSDMALFLEECIRLSKRSKADRDKYLDALKNN